MKPSERILRLRQAVIESVRQGCIAYAIGKGGKPIVDQHFTAGNQERYGWAPLSEAYFKRKAGLLKFAHRGILHGSKLDKNAGYRAKSATVGVTQKSGSNLPMLVNSGDLRFAVNANNSTITVINGNGHIAFRGLPGYAKWLHTGTAKMAKRSPVEPSEADREAVIAIMQNYLHKRMGR